MDLVLEEILVMLLGVEVLEEQELLLAQVSMALAA